jgi:anti-sigma factor RsiW
MVDETLDPRLEKLVALLYGELPDEEARKVRDWIAGDSELRRTWDEMNETREALGSLDPVPTPDASFLVDVVEAKTPSPIAAAHLPGWGERLRAAFTGGGIP